MQLVVVMSIFVLVTKGIGLGRRVIDVPKNQIGFLRFFRCRSGVVRNGFLGSQLTPRLNQPILMNGLPAMHIETAGNVHEIPPKHNHVDAAFGKSLHDQVTKGLCK